MLSDIKLKIRHAKRGNEKTLDLSGMGMSELPIDITQLTMLESLNISNNKLTSLRRCEQLPNLRAINAQNNLISALHPEIQDMYCLDTINLVGNPVVNTFPEIARIENNKDSVDSALSRYFGGGQPVGVPSMQQQPIQKKPLATISPYGTSTKPQPVTQNSVKVS
jgi:Leucine-rich repeat (LRR) protein